MSDPLVDLQFQEFGIEPPAKSTSTTSGTKPMSTTFHFSNFPNSPGDDDAGSNDSGKMLLNENDGQQTSAPSFWTFGYYQRFFDVDTDIVMRRVVNSMIPRFGTNFILHHVRPSPDLCGPWWISTTLIFTIAIASNLGGYFAVSGNEDDYHWSLEFGVVTGAATAIFTYVWLVPLILYGLLWWRKSEESFSFTEILCAYGYSLSIYVPISLLWVFPYSWLQWTLIAIGLASSGLVLVISLWPAVRHDKRLFAFCIMAAVIGIHALLAIGFKMVFFHTVDTTRASGTNKTILTGPIVQPTLTTESVNSSQTNSSG